jgi:hypothetical protein
MDERNAENLDIFQIHVGTVDGIRSDAWSLNEEQFPCMRKPRSVLSKYENLEAVDLLTLNTTASKNELTRYI